MYTPPQSKLEACEFRYTRNGLATCTVCPRTVRTVNMTSSELLKHTKTQAHKGYANLRAEDAAFTRASESEHDKLHAGSSAATPSLVSGTANDATDAPGFDEGAFDFLDGLENHVADPLVKSFVRTLRAQRSQHQSEEVPLHDMDEGDVSDDPTSEADDDWYSDGIFEERPAGETLPTMNTTPSVQKSEWFPWPDKATFLTHILFNAPRLRFSRAQQIAILSWAKELGANPPSYDKVRRTQAELKNKVGNPTRRECSSRGNVWYLNEISESVAKDFANPITRNKMGPLYPEDLQGRMKQVWNAAKLLVDIPDSLLTMNVRHNDSIFYVGELIRRDHGDFFVAKRWILRSGQHWGLGHHVRRTQDGSLHVATERLVAVRVSSFKANVIDIIAENKDQPLMFDGQSAEYEAVGPHPMREKAGRRMVYSVPIIVFIDDVSGNQSKQWNKHFACYISNGLLTREALMEEFHVRFVAASPTATPLEIMHGVRSSIERAFQDPITAYDALDAEEVLLRPFPLLFAGDNPMQAELCSCAGLNGNHFCRTCHVGGSQEYKRSDAGFESIFKSGAIRTTSDTREKIFEQLVTALEPNVTTKLVETVRDSGVKDGVAQPIIDRIVKLGQQLRKSSTPEQATRSPEEVQAILSEELRKAHGRGQTYNPLLDVEGVNIHEDTPTEILHTILLGVVKYFWAQTVFFLEKEKHFGTFQTRLDSISSDGLNIPAVPADYICQYKGALIGKHFKTLSQVMAFTVYDLVPQNVLDAWLLLSRLTVMLWHTEIRDINVYLAELQQCIDNFLDVTALCSPTILISKPKFHFLVHLPFYIRRFGPAILYSTERYESYNAVFRAASMHSNRMAPSRDIAWTFAGMDCIKHVATGGWWMDKLTGEWVCAGPGVTRYLGEHPEHRKLLGLRIPDNRSPGHVILLRATTEPGRKASPVVIEWENTAAHMAGLTLSTVLEETSVGHPQMSKASLQFRIGRAVMAENGDSVDVGHFAVVRCPSDMQFLFCKIIEVLVAPRSPDTIQLQDSVVYVTIQLFELGKLPHERLDMPTLTLIPARIVIRPSQLVCAVNLQHDCHQGQCTTDGLRAAFVEREQLSTVTRKVISHSDETSYIVNAGSLHNYHHIHDALPPHLRTSSFKISDSRALRQHAANLVRERKKQQNEERHDLLAEKVAERAVASSPHNAETSQLKDLLQTDDDILDAIGNLLGETEPEEVDSRNPQPESEPFSLPVFDPGVSRARKARAIDNLASSPNDVLKELCREHKLALKGKKGELIKRLENFYAGSQIPFPTAEQLNVLHRQVQARNVLAKSAKSAGKRKRAEGDDGNTDGITELLEGDASTGSSKTGILKKRRGAVDDDVRQSNVRELHKLLMERA